MSTVIETDSRKPDAKHAILAMYAAHGLEFPDTPVMALHRGRIDLLEQHLSRDPGLLSRTFSHREIYPSEVGCLNEIDATTGTRLTGTTLLHMCVDYDELEIARWLLDHGMDVNARAAMDGDGFGGYTALFCTVMGTAVSRADLRERAGDAADRGSRRATVMIALWRRSARRGSALGRRAVPTG